MSARSSSLSVTRVLAATLAAVGAPVLLVNVAACGSSGGSTPGGAHPGSDASGGDGAAGGADGGSDGAPRDDGGGEIAPSLDAGFANGDPPQSFDGGPYLLFYGQSIASGALDEAAPAFHLFDEGTLASAGDFLVAPVASSVLNVTRDPAGATWWTTARVADGSVAATAYTVDTGVLSTGPIVVAPAGLDVTSPAFAVGAAGTVYIGGGAGVPGLFSAIASSGVVTPIAVPAAFTAGSGGVNAFAYDSTVGLLAGTSPFVSGGAAAAPYVLVVSPGSTTATAAPATWSAVFPVANAGASPDSGTTTRFAGITALTVAPGGHLVYGLTSIGLAIVDLTASTGSVVATPGGFTPSAGAVPVVTADGAHVVFTASAADLSRELLVFDTASKVFTPIADTPGYVFANELALAGDGARIYGVELANLPSATSQIVRVDPVARTLAQTAPWVIDERASLVTTFFAAQ
jgi:hypothetical protein